MLLTDMLEEPLTSITLVYGPGGSGKSTAALQVIQGKCAYIATQHNFSPERLQTIKGNLEHVSLFSPHDLVELERAVEQAVQLSRVLTLIVLDSLGTYLRVTERKAANLALERILTKLGLAVCPVLIISDALDKPARETELSFVGGDLLRLHARTIIEFNTGVASVKKHPVLAGRVWEYTIDTAGLRKI